MKFDFRTFYPNGMLMMLRNLKRQAYLLLHLKGGKLYVDFKGKTTRQMISQGNLNDGQWHSVRFTQGWHSHSLLMHFGFLLVIVYSFSG